LRVLSHDKSHANAGGQAAVAYQCHGSNVGEMGTVRSGNGGTTGGVPFVVQDTSGRDKAQNGRGWSGEGVAYTVDAAATQGVSQPLQPQGIMHSESEVQYADAEEARSAEALCVLRKEVGEEAFQEWSVGILAALWTPEVLRPLVHGESLRRTRWDGRGLVDGSLPCSEESSERALRGLWRAGCTGRGSQRWKPPEQLTRQLAAYLSKLSQQEAPQEAVVRCLWRASEGLGLLRQALSAVQKVGRSARSETEPTPPPYAVRRITPREAERLQGFPDDYTLIPYRNKPAEKCPDGPRYRALGNSMAVPVMEWIGRRIVESHSSAS
jgi:hypothetical protein